ncbi:unnamed protein product [Paramecium primaurelia]|uniref:WD-40 repeat protein n=1 Tax=Paramecium primaurelia TaxID=5886 RepID=A0A8S1QRL9_PARPR|nr:unnamed protein product [Paramecium primaurelia]
MKIKKKMQGSFLDKEALADIFGQIKDVDEQMFGFILEKLRKENVQDYIGYLSDKVNQRQIESYILQQGEKIAQADKEKKFSLIGNDMKQIADVLRKLKDHEFNSKDFSSQENEELKLILIKSIKDNRGIIEFLQFQFNSLPQMTIQYNVVKMKVDLRNKNFENIKIQNTSLQEANFFRCILSGSQFNNVNISRINLNGAELLNCKWKNLRIHHELNTLNVHRGCVNSVCFSPDGNTLASGSNDKSLRLWNVKTGQQKAQLDGHQYQVHAVCFSPNGNTLASGSNDKSIRLWDVKTGQQKAKLDGHSRTVLSICFSPDGNTLASGSGDQSLSLWDVKKKQQKAKLEGHSGTVWSVCFSPDGNTLASGSVDNSIRLWDVKTGYEINSSDKNYKDVLAQLTIPLQQNSHISQTSNYLNSLLISQQAIFQTQGALILKGEFINQSVQIQRHCLNKKEVALQKIYRKSDFDHYQTTIIITINIQQFHSLLLYQILFFFTSKFLIFKVLFHFCYIYIPHLFQYYYNRWSVQCCEQISRFHKTFILLQQIQDII